MGSKKDDWQAESGVACLRSECNFYHPPRVEAEGFHWEQIIKPPIMKKAKMMTSTAKIPVRIPVIVRNEKKMKEDLTQRLEGLALD